MQIALAVPAGALQFMGFELCKEKLREVLPDQVRLSGTLAYLCNLVALELTLVFTLVANIY